MLKTWDGIKFIININKKEKKDINCFTVDDQQATGTFVISNYFNRFFTTIAKTTEGKPNEVQSLIKALNLEKATRSNIIPTK